MLLTKSKNKNSLVLIDYANLKSAAKHLGKWTDLAILYNHLRGLAYINKISIYYGTDPNNPGSFSFINHLRSIGYEVITKDVKYIKLNLRDTIFNHRTKQALDKLDSKMLSQLNDNIKKVENTGVLFEQPKCNLDIEIALDISNGLETYDSFILFSGDSDFENILKIAKSKRKHITIISLRKFTSGEVIKNSDRYINLKDFANELPGFLYHPIQK
jgi:uncharacterized LabA/DUF88 family protein